MNRHNQPSESHATFRAKSCATRLVIVVVVLAAAAFVCPNVADTAAGATCTVDDGGGEVLGYMAEVTGSAVPEEEWNKTFGGIHCDYALSLQQTTDDGYILTGGTSSYGAGSGDFWLVKADSNGNEQWNKTFGGASSDRAESVRQTTDGGYILAGRTESYGAGNYDFWLVKTDSNGNEQWNKTFGGTGGDWAFSVQQTTDGGYILTGHTESYGAGSYDAWLVKTDSDGNKEWDKTFGEDTFDRAYAVQQTTDSGYVLAGYTYSYGASSGDFWLIKLTAATQISGDLNNDGSITPADAVIALEIAIGSRPCDPQCFIAADVSGDNRVTSLDALMILQAAVGAITL